MSRSFDGVNDIINVGNSSGLNNLTSLTYAAWAAPDTSGESNGGKILNKQAGGSNEKAFGFSNTNTMNLFIQRTTNASASFVEIPDSTWHFYAGTFTNVAPNSIRLYKDGEEVTYIAQTTGAGTVTTDAARFQCIGNGAAGTRTWDGLLAYVHIYNRVLSLGEINQIMFYPGSIRKGLVGFWPLMKDDTVINDYSGSGYYAGNVGGSIVGTSEPPINGIFLSPRPELMRSF